MCEGKICCLADDLQKAATLKQKSYLVTNFGFQLEIPKNESVFRDNILKMMPQTMLSITFEIILPPKYPYGQPQVICLSPFAPPVLSLCDGRDLYDEIVG